MRGRELLLASPFGVLAPRAAATSHDAVSTVLVARKSSPPRPGPQSLRSRSARRTTTPMRRMTTCQLTSSSPGKRLPSGSCPDPILEPSCRRVELKIGRKNLSDRLQIGFSHRVSSSSLTRRRRSKSGQMFTKPAFHNQRFLAAHSRRCRAVSVLIRPALVCGSGGAGCSSNERGDDAGGVTIE
jgi:hypothetical protein